MYIMLVASGAAQSPTVFLSPTRGPRNLNAGPGVGEGGVLELLKDFTTQTKNWLNGPQFRSQLLFFVKLVPE